MKMGTFGSLDSKVNLGLREKWVQRLCPSLGRGITST